MTSVDNSLSPHGGALIERVIPLSSASDVAGLPAIEVREQIAHECVNLAYGFFSPLTGFMGSADVDSVADNMRLASGYVWPIPIVLDVPHTELLQAGVSAGDTILLTHQGNPLATLESPRYSKPTSPNWPARCTGPPIRRTRACSAP